MGLTRRPISQYNNLFVLKDKNREKDGVDKENSAASNNDSRCDAHD
jgi:hypothetical protein